MNEKILEQLDYNRIKDEIKFFCVSQEGKNRLENVKPICDAEKIEFRKNLSGEWLHLLKFTKNVHLPAWAPVEQALSILGVKGASLKLDELFALGQFCQAVSFLAGIFKKESDYSKSCPVIFSQICKMYDISPVENQIFRVIDNNGELREIDEIKQIKQSIRKKNSEIENCLKKYTASPDFSDFLQSSLPVLRAGRQVVAVKSGFKNRIKGIVHEVSQTGSTIYIEPEEIVQLSNQIIEEEALLERKIKIILTEVTEKIGQFKNELEQNLYQMTLFDCAQASSKWGIENDAVFAQCANLAEGENILLKKARHPILGKSAVPIDVAFSSGTKTLIITGANTGGKTVTLKTIALFVLLNQSGFPILAEFSSMLPVFDEVFADIGDEQSMDESLSTFSAHMKNISFAIENATEKSLVLLDELGSGTDPQEGCAIAMAVLDFFIKKGSFVILTTHHSAIKNYGYTHENCLNASVEFDSKTLSPTYKIVMGVPGSSHALEIAKRSGLPLSVIEDAKSYIDTNQVDVATLIRGLTEKYAQASKLEEELKQKEVAINEKWRKVDLKNLQVKQHELELREQGYRESKKFLEESRKKLENLVRELKEGEVSHEKNIKVKKMIQEISEKIESEKTEIQEKSKEIDNQGSRDVQNFEVGDCVKIGKKKLDGIIVKKEKNGKYLVQAGSVKLTIGENELTKSGKSTNKKAVSVEIEQACTSKTEFSSSAQTEKPVFELCLLGMRYEEAIKMLEHQLDLCCINNFKNFSIIHGKGEGILQKAVWDYLKTYPFVESWNFASPEDGGTGKTYVVMR